MINTIKSSLSRNITNAKGWKTNRKIVVFESDDWGSIRMKDKAAYQSLLEHGIKVNKSKYDSIDCLESKADLEHLFNTLLSIKNTNNRNPIFTFNTVMQNPDFEKIRENNFEKFVGEDFRVSYQRYYGETSFPLWEEAIKKNLMFPQLHAKEHLNAYLWLNDLRKKYLETSLAFDHSFFGLKTKTSSINRNYYLASFYAESYEEFDYVETSLIEGLNLFKSVFGTNSETFIACNYFWPKELEKTLYENSVKTIQGQRVQVAPELIGNKLNKIRHFTGQKNEYGQRYTVRNVSFEPFVDPKLNWALKSFKEIENAFRWKTPAIISSHRINYVGNICVKNREENMGHLKALLLMIVQSYPEVEFMSSQELSRLIHLDKPLKK